MAEIHRHQGPDTGAESASRPAKFAKWFQGRLRHTMVEEDGGSMVFGAITMFTLVLFVAMIFNTGMLSADQMAAQNAADSCAYSGAVVGADAVNSVAEINDGMAYIYYALMRYHIDAITFSVLEEFQEIPNFRMLRSSSQVLSAAQNPLPFSGSVDTNPKPDDGVIYPFGSTKKDPISGAETFQGFSTTGPKVIEDSKKMVDAGREWLKTLAQAERVIARATPKLIQKAILDVAKDNGAERVAIFPAMSDDLFYGGQDSIFQDAEPNNDDLVPEPFAERFQKKKLLYGVAVETPDTWYLDRKGESAPGEGYFQIRLCWNQHDFFHNERDQTKHGGADNWRYTKGSPNGHWHKKHGGDVHQWFNPDTFTVEPIPGDHWSGHGNDLLDLLVVDPRWHLFAVDRIFGGGGSNFAHHQIQECPTCVAQSFSSPASGYTEIKVTQKGNFASQIPNTQSGDKTLETKYQKLFEGEAPLPLVMTEAISYTGINVAIHRDSRDPIIGSIFQKPGWGSLACASAQIGILKEGSGQEHFVDVKNNGETWFEDFYKGNVKDDKRNLFLANKSNNDGDETYFSARLVPMTGRIYGKDGGSGGLSGNTGFQRLFSSQGNLWLDLDGNQDPKGREAMKVLQNIIRFGSPKDQANIHH